jgi:hypothetical protein
MQLQILAVVEVAVVVSQLLVLSPALVVLEL